MYFCEGKAELFPLGENVFMQHEIIHEYVRNVRKSRRWLLLDSSAKHQILP
jgi:hypothetical protein